MVSIQSVFSALRLQYSPLHTGLVSAVYHHPSARSHPSLSLINSNFCSVVFFRTSSFRTLFFHETLAASVAETRDVLFSNFFLLCDRQTPSRCSALLSDNYRKKDDVHIRQLIWFSFAHAIPASITNTQ